MKTQTIQFGHAERTSEWGYTRMKDSVPVRGLKHYNRSGFSQASLSFLLISSIRDALSLNLKAPNEIMFWGQFGREFQAFDSHTASLRPPYVFYFLL